MENQYYSKEQLRKDQEKEFKKSLGMTDFRKVFKFSFNVLADRIGELEKLVAGDSVIVKKKPGRPKKKSA